MSLRYHRRPLGGAVASPSARRSPPRSASPPSPPPTSNVTALLRNGDRVAGRFDGFNNRLVYIDVSDTDERKIPVGDVVLLDFVGGAQGLPETELSQARGDDHVLLLKSGNASKGRLVTIEGTDRDPTRRVPDDLRRGAARAASPRSAASTSAATRARHRRWTPPSSRAAATTPARRAPSP